MQSLAIPLKLRFIRRYKNNPMQMTGGGLDAYF